MKPILGFAAAYLFLLWLVCAAVYVTKSRTVVYNGGALAPFVVLAALFTVASVAAQRRAWRSEAGFGVALLTSVVAGLSVTALLFVLSLGGG